MSFVLPVEHPSRIVNRTKDPVGRAGHRVNMQTSRTTTKAGAPNEYSIANTPAMTWSRALAFQSHGCVRRALRTPVSDTVISVVVQDPSSGARTRLAESIFNVLFMLVENGFCYYVWSCYGPYPSCLEYFWNGPFARPYPSLIC